MLRKIFLTALLLTMLINCQRSMEERSVYLLGTYIRVSSQDSNFTPALWETISQAIEQIHRRMNAYVAYEESELLRLKSLAGTSPATLSPETYHLIEQAVAIAHITDGAFNPAVQPLIALWGFGTEHQQLPDDAAIQATLPLLDYRHIQLLNPPEIWLEKEGMGVDLGGIAKGYAAELTAELLQEAGISHALLDFGGNIVTMGEKPSGEPWRIGLRNPFDSHTEIFGVLQTKPGLSVITSGAYERYFVIDGTSYHHIFDYRSGYPADSDVASVTIVSTDGVAADAFSTAGFVLGLNKARKLIDEQEGIEAILVDTERGVWISPSLQDVFTLKDTSFTMKPWQ